MSRAIDVGEAIVLDNISSALVPGGISICGWYKFTTFPASGYAVVLGIVGNDAGWELRISSAGLLTLFTSGSSISDAASSALSLNTYYHLGVSMQAPSGSADRHHIGYVNGATLGMDITDYAYTLINGNNAIVVGQDNNGNNKNAAFLVGYLRLAQAVWSAAQFTQEMGSPTAVNTVVSDTDMISSLGSWEQQGTVSDSNDEPSFFAELLPAALPTNNAKVEAISQVDLYGLLATSNARVEEADVSVDNPIVSDSIGYLPSKVLVPLVLN